MTVFALIRHAEHALVGHTIVGRAPGVGLSEVGSSQAGRLAGRLQDLSIGAVYSSPMERARETAAVIGAGLGLETRNAEELNEIAFGTWTNHTLSELHELEEWRRFNLFRSGSEIPDGETMLEVQSRMLRLIERLRARHPGQTVALVSHGDVIKSTLAHYLGVPLDLFHRIEISPASVSILEVEHHGARVLLVNGFAEDGLLSGIRAAP